MAKNSGPAVKRLGTASTRRFGGAGKVANLPRPAEASPPADRFKMRQNAVAVPKSKTDTGAI